MTPPWASGICRGLRALGIRHVIHVPDNPLSHMLTLLAREYPEIICTTATREEEAFGIAGGLFLGGARPVVMCQSSGIGNSLNVLTSFLIPYRIPIVSIVSMRGLAGEWNAAQAPMGQAMTQILDSIGIPHALIQRSDAAEETVARLGALAGQAQVPAAVLLSSAQLKAES